MTRYKIRIMDAKKSLGYALPSADHYEMHGYAESTVIRNAKYTARKVGATRFSIMKDDKLLGIWLFNMSNGRWERGFGFGW